MAELLLVRHGQALFGAENYDGLSLLGQDQAKALGAYLGASGWQPDLLISGSLIRQHETLSLMGLGVDVRQSEGFNEYPFEDLLQARFGQIPRDSGIKEAKPLFRALKDAVLAWQRGEIPGCRESWHEFTARVDAALDHATSTGARRVLVVTSGGVIGHIVARTLGAPDAKMMDLNLQIRNSSITRFLFSNGAISLCEFNGIPHIADRPGMASLA